jgi:hypothetical protein
MDEVGAIADALERSLEEVEPAPFHSRVTAAVGERPLLPGVLTVRVARTVEPTADIQTAATRGAGVQLCYEGLELTRAVLRNRAWESEGGTEYQQDLLVAEVLVSRGFHLLARTGVVTDAVAIVQRFGRTQTALDDLGHRHEEAPLEVDVLELAVNAGVDLVMDGVPASVRAHSGDIASELLDYPLPDPDAVGAVDGHLDALAADARVAGANR